MVIDCAWERRRTPKARFWLCMPCQTSTPCCSACNSGCTRNKRCFDKAAAPFFDILQTAASRLQGGWCGERGGFGVLAAGLILREAGGVLAGESGHPDIATSDEFLFGNPRMLRELLRLRAAASS